MELRIQITNLNPRKWGLTEEFPLAGRDGLTLGRDASCDIRCESGNDVVSRRHARITPCPGEPGALLIEDLGSSNGTFVNRRRVVEPVRLHSGDRIQLGRNGQEYAFTIASFDVEPVRTGGPRYRTFLLAIATGLFLALVAATGLLIFGKPSAW